MDQLQTNDQTFRQTIPKVKSDSFNNMTGVRTFLLACGISLVLVLRQMPANPSPEIDSPFLAGDTCLRAGATGGPIYRSLQHAVRAALRETRLKPIEAPPFQRDALAHERAALHPGAGTCKASRCQAQRAEHASLWPIAASSMLRRKTTFALPTTVPPNSIPEPGKS